MGWPFSSAVAPSLDSGFVAVPTSLTDVPNVASEATALWLMGASLANNTDNPISVEVTAGDGTSIIIPNVPTGGRAVVTFEWAFMPVTGLRWIATAAGVTGKIWGYQ